MIPFVGAVVRCGAYLTTHLAHGSCVGKPPGCRDGLDQTVVCRHRAGVLRQLRFSCSRTPLVNHLRSSVILKILVNRAFVAATVKCSFPRPFDVLFVTEIITLPNAQDLMGVTLLCRMEPAGVIRSLLYW